MQQSTSQKIGWYGVIAILIAYTAVSLGWLSITTMWYQLLNLSGALAIVVVAASKKDHQPMVLNLVWAAIALIALLRLWM